jgi:hypothetical protein
MDDKDFKQLLRARDAALLSMDERRIRAYFQKYNGNPGPADPETFWRGVHKARTALKTLPMEERTKSKRWLIEHGSEPMDDGEVPV